MYESSKNLIDDSAFKPYVKVVFCLRANKEIGMKRNMYLCPYCKKIWKTNPLKPQPVSSDDDYEYICKHCGTEVNMVTIESCYDMRKYKTKKNNGNPPVVYNMSNIQTILIGMKKDDADGHVVSVNGTIFRQHHMVQYRFDDATQTLQQVYKTYMTKQRIVCNLDVKQVYLIDNVKAKDDQFEYVVPKVYDTFYANVNYDCDVAYILRKLILQKIYKVAYGYSLPSLVDNLKSMTDNQLFYMMKFPVLSSYAFYVSMTDVSPILFDVFKQVDEIDHSLVSIRTKDALEQVKSTGKRLGRPKGSESKLFFLDAHKGEIMNMLERGESIGSICEHFNVSKNTFYKYRKKFFRS